MCQNILKISSFDNETVLNFSVNRLFFTKVFDTPLVSMVG